MAPLSQGRGRSRGTATRGRSGVRGRGRGRGGFAARGGNKSTFNPTRVEEHVEDSSDRSEESEKTEQEEAVDVISDEVSSDEEDRIKSAVKPYNALLQSLNANIQRGQPQRKKQKVNDGTGGNVTTTFSDGNTVQDAVDGDVDEVEEPEEGGNLGVDGLDTAEDVDDDDGGKRARRSMSI